MPGPVEPGAAPSDGCRTSAQCPAGFFCVDGACQMSPPEQCKADRDCYPGTVCASGACVDPGNVGDPDAGQPDAGTGGNPDAGTTGGDPDAGTGGTPDAGPPDAGPPVGVTNGDFESGALTGWTSAGVTAAVAGGHTGGFAAQVGATGASHDSSISQQIHLPSGGPQLSFWYKSACQDIVSFDYGTVTVLDLTGALLATPLDKTCDNSGAWVQVTADLSAWAGQAVVVSFNNHDDGYAGDPTYTLYDDIKVGSSAPDFSISAAPGSVSGAGSATIATAASNGFSGSIVLSVSGAPAGASASLSSTSISAGGSSTLTLSPGSAAGGTYAVKVTGTSGALTHVAAVSWTIAGAALPDFSMSASPSSVSGASSATLSVTAANGFAGSVSLSVSGVPGGATASLSTSSVSGSGSSTLSLNPGTGAAGTYSVTVTGTSGSLTHSATVSWTIAAQVCTTDTWANYAHTFMVNKCVGCHSQFNTWSNVNSDRSSIQSRISSGNMPQGSTLSSSDKSRILKWLSCGLPQ